MPGLKSGEMFMNNKEVLWYENAACIWEEALPVGNGRLGAMVYSDPIRDTLQVNEDTIWSGCPNVQTQTHNITEIKEIRKLVAQKKYVEADKRTREVMSGIRSECYVPYGDLHIDIIAEKNSISDYRRELDMSNGLVNSTYTLNGIAVEKEYFSSLVDDVIVVHIKASEKIIFHIYQSVVLEHNSKKDGNVVITEGRCPTHMTCDTNSIEYDGNESIHFASCIGVKTDAIHYCGGGSIWVKSTEELTVIFSLKTSFNGFDKLPVTQGKEYIKASRTALDSAKAFTYDELKERHIKEYKRYFDRSELAIEGEDFSDVPTDKRIENAANGTVDNGLVNLLFDFGKYLTISSSAEGTQPTTLQGIWNKHLMAPWHCNYTMNINTQMNYWPTETVNLPEFHMPFMEMLRDLAKKGNIFGFNGWSSWHNSDIWRFNNEATTNPQCGFWPMGGFWSVRHIWEHFLHTRDKNFLKEYYHVMIGAAEFLQDWMYENDKGELTTCPSTSPENQFIYDGEKCAVCEGSAIDMSIIYDLFDKLIKAGDILGEQTEKYKEILKKLKPVEIGSDGRIREWDEEFEENESGHRHISHVYGFFPADIMTDEKYTKAVRETLRVRIENGSGYTGWSNAWIANVYARLGDGEKVMYHIRNMFKNSIYPNMFDSHPPFQIDGNFGIVSAICEALMQSHKGRIERLSALPKEWKSGYVKGFVARTGETVDFEWKDGKILYMEVRYEQRKV